MLRVLVTGGHGYIGLPIVKALSTECSVVSFGHAPRTVAARNRIPAGVESIESELDAVGQVMRTRGPFHAVIHLAGGGGSQKCEADPVAAVHANIRATTGLLEAARATGVGRLLYASTIAVYGTHRVPDGPYRESHEARPDELYGAVKEAGEHAWVALGGGTSLRLANVYGAGIGVDMGIQGAAERFARAAAAGGTLSLFGTGAQRIDYVHIDDVVDAFRKALGAPSPPPHVNIGSGAPASIAEIAESCMAAGRRLGASPSLERKPAPPGKSWPDRSLDIGLAQGALGWTPKTSLDDGLAELVRMMKSASGAEL